MTLFPEDQDHPLEAKVRDLERRLAAVERTDRLIASSVSAGGLTIKGGFIRWLDAAGVETARFATDGLTLEGLLKVIGNVQVDGGSIEILDAAGVAQLTLGTDEMTLAGVLKMLSDANIETYDVDGDLRAELGSNLFFRDKTTGEVVQSLGLLSTGEFGLLVEEPDGVGDLVILHPGVFLSTHVNGVSAIRVSGNEIILRYNTGEVAVDLDQDLTISGPGTRGVVIRVNELDGIRFAVDTDADGVQSGKVTAGAADSAGAGFRTLRIPN